MHSSSVLGLDSFCSGLFGITLHRCLRWFFVQHPTVWLWSSRTLECSTYECMPLCPYVESRHIFNEEYHRAGPSHEPVSNSKSRAQFIARKHNRLYLHDNCLQQSELVQKFDAARYLIYSHCGNRCSALWWQCARRSVSTMEPAI